jgi:hypothetical protein
MARGKKRVPVSAGGDARRFVRKDGKVFRVGAEWYAYDLTRKTYVRHCKLFGIADNPEDEAKCAEFIARPRSGSWTVLSWARQWLKNLEAEGKVGEGEGQMTPRTHLKYGRYLEALEGTELGMMPIAQADGGDIAAWAETFKGRYANETVRGRVVAVTRAFTAAHEGPR